MFNDSEQDRFAIGETCNILKEHVDLLQLKLEALEFHFENLRNFRDRWLSKQEELGKTSLSTTCRAVKSLNAPHA